MNTRPSYHYATPFQEHPSDGFWITPSSNKWLLEFVGPGGKRQRIAEFDTPHAAALAVANHNTGNASWDQMKDLLPPSDGTMQSLEVLKSWRRID